MAVPSFLKETDDKLIFNQSGDLLYFVPEAYFTETKSSIAVVVGEYVSVMGVFDWALADESGKIGKIRNFRFPTIFLCKPSRIETMKNFSINESVSTNCVFSRCRGELKNKMENDFKILKEKRFK